MTSLAAFRTSIVAAAALALSACGINSVPTKEEAAKAALRLAAAKLPIPTTIVGKADYFMEVTGSSDMAGSR